MGEDDRPSKGQCPAVLHSIHHIKQLTVEPTPEKICLRRFRPGPTQTELYCQMARGSKFRI